jgi:hypothetical protein
MPHLQDLSTFVYENTAHECGHIVILLKAKRLAGLNFLPHELAEDKTTGVLETNVGDQLNKDDCVALAGGMAGELIYLGKPNRKRLLDDRKNVRRLVGRPLKDFVPDACKIIKDNLRFFELLNIDVRKRMLAVMKNARSLSPASPPSIHPIPNPGTGMPTCRMLH